MGKVQKEIPRSEEHTSELQSPCNLVCRLLLEKKYRNIRVFISTCDFACDFIRCKSTMASLSQCAITPLHLCNVKMITLYFFNDQETTEIYTLSLQDALQI